MQIYLSILPSFVALVRVIIEITKALWAELETQVTSMSNLEIVKRLYTAFRQRDTNTILELFDPQIEWIQNEGFPGGGRHVGSDAVINDVFAKFRHDWETWQVVVDEWLDAGDTIIALGEYRGTHKSTSKSMTAAFAHVYKLKNSRIVRFQQYTDTLKIASVIQLTPKLVVGDRI